MPSSRIEEFHHVVLGPGALGTALAASLSAREPIVLLGRSPSQGQVRLVHAHGSTSVALPWARSPDAVLLQLPPRTLGRSLAVWVTLPPERAAPVGIDVLSTLARAGEKRIVAVFGNNGLLAPELFAPLLAELPADVELVLLRALFFTGFIRDGEDGARVVRHTGGHRVVVGPLLDEPQRGAPWNACRSSAEALFARAPSARAGVDLPKNLFAFEWDDDVRATEVEKFYVNVMLAFGTGPLPLPNGGLVSRMGEERLARWAASFTRLFPVRGVSLGEARLRESLARTVGSTATNINSVSLAGHRGEVETLWSFVELLKSARAAHPLPHGEDAFFETELARVEREWGRPIPCSR